MKKLLILSTSFVSLMRHDKFLLFVTQSFHSTFEYFFCRNRPGIRVFEFLLDSQRESANFVAPKESWSVHCQSCVSEFLGRSTQVSKQRVSPFYHDWLTTTDRTTGLLLQSDRLVIGTHQGASCRWWRHRSRSHQGTAARSRTPGCIRHKPLWWSGRWAHNLWEARSRPGCQGPQRKYAGYLSTTSWKLKVSGSRNSRVIREMMRKEMNWMEKSERSEATLTARMNHEDDHGMIGDSNLSQTVCVHLNKEHSQGTMTLTDNKEERLQKTKDLQCMMPHALASTTLTDFPSVSGHFTHCWAFPSALCVIKSIVVTVPKFIQFLTCTRIPCRDSHCENGFVRCCLCSACHPWLDLDDRRWEAVSWQSWRCNCTSVPQQWHLPTATQKAQESPRLDSRSSSHTTHHGRKLRKTWRLQNTCRQVAFWVFALNHLLPNCPHLQDLVHPSALSSLLLSCLPCSLGSLDTFLLSWKETQHCGMLDISSQFVWCLCGLHSLFALASADGTWPLASALVTLASFSCGPQNEISPSEIWRMALDIRTITSLHWASWAVDMETDDTWTTASMRPQTHTEQRTEVGEPNLRNQMRQHCVPTPNIGTWRQANWSHPNCWAPTRRRLRKRLNLGRRTCTAPERLLQPDTRPRMTSRSLLQLQRSLCSRHLRPLDFCTPIANTALPSDLVGQRAHTSALAKLIARIVKVHACQAWPWQNRNQQEVSPLHHGGGRQRNCPRLGTDLWSKTEMWGSRHLMHSDSSPRTSVRTLMQGDRRPRTCHHREEWPTSPHLSQDTPACVPASSSKLYFFAHAAALFGRVTYAFVLTVFDCVLHRTAR